MFSEKDCADANNVIVPNTTLVHPSNENIFQELETGRNSSWQYELQQVRFANQRLEEEIRAFEDSRASLAPEEARVAEKSQRIAYQTHGYSSPQEIQQQALDHCKVGEYYDGSHRTSTRQRQSHSYSPEIKMSSPVEPPLTLGRIDTRTVTAQPLFYTQQQPVGQLLSMRGSGYGSDVNVQPGSYARHSFSPPRPGSGGSGSRVGMGMDFNDVANVHMDPGINVNNGMGMAMQSQGSVAGATAPGSLLRSGGPGSSMHSHIVAPHPHSHAYQQSFSSNSNNNGHPISMHGRAPSVSIDLPMLLHSPLSHNSPWRSPTTAMQQEMIAVRSGLPHKRAWDAASGPT